MAKKQKALSIVVSDTGDELRSSVIQAGKWSFKEFHYAITMMTVHLGKLAHHYLTETTRTSREEKNKSLREKQ